MDYYFVTYGLTLIAFVITTIAQLFVTTTYKKYSNVRNERNMTGAEAARELLDKNNLHDVKVVEVSGYLTDHYDPRNKEVRLSSNNYRGTSISSVSVACHECGHAIQDKVGYVFMRIRASLVPVVNFSSYAGYISIVLGMLFSSINLIWLGILLEIVILLFQIVTLPVEIDASKRALKELDYSHFFNSKELKNGRSVLVAAALTYVASVASTLLQILRLILMFGRRND